MTAAADESNPIYRRVVLKLSGESLSRAGERGINMEEVADISRQIKLALEQGCQVAIVCGGGNILRGAQFKEKKCSNPRSNCTLHGHASDGHQRISVARCFGMHRLSNPRHVSDSNGRSS